jgi:predicted MFS family arabinose efflux permease
MMIDRKLLYRAEKESKPIWPAIKEVLHELKTDSRFMVATILISSLSMFVMPVVFLMPIFADNTIGGGAITLGWLMAAGGIGSLTGAVVLSRRKSSEGLTILAAKALVGSAIFLIAFAFSKNIFLALAMLALMGFCTTFTVSSVMTLTQNLSPNHLRGRVMSVITTAFMGLAPIGSVLAGIMAKSFGAPIAVGSCGLIALLIGFVGWVKVRKIHKPEILDDIA